MWPGGAAPRRPHGHAAPRSGHDAVDDAQRSSCVVAAEVTEGLPPAEVSHLEEAGAQHIAVLEKLLVVPGERLPILVFGERLRLVEPADVAPSGVLEGARQAGLGDDGLQAVPVAGADGGHGGPVEKVAPVAEPAAG